MISKQGYVKILESLKEFDDVICQLGMLLGIAYSVFDSIINDMLKALCQKIGDIESYDNEVLDWLSFFE